MAKKTAAPKKTLDTSRWVGREATDAAVKKFEETFLKQMGDDLSTPRHNVAEPYEVISTGSIALDQALHIGGWPKGRVCEVWGPEHAGKTSLLMLTVAEAQKRYPNKMVAWLDMEQTFDEKWAMTLGVDLTRLWRPPVRTAEDVADKARRFIESGLCSVVIIDSVGAMIARVEFEKESDEATVAIVAKIVTRAVKQASSIGASNGTTTIVVNQVRANIGGYGSPEQESGGWALKHITSIKMYVRRGDSITVTRDSKEVPVGHFVSIRVTKNKTAPYGNSCDFMLKNQHTTKYGPPGVDIVAEATGFAAKSGVVRQAGGWYYCDPEDPEFKVQGADKLEDFLREHPELVAKIREQIVAQAAEAVDAGAVAEVPMVDLSEVDA